MKAPDSQGRSSTLAPQVKGTARRPLTESLRFADDQ